MQPYVEFDMSLAPVILITFTGNEPTEENFRAYLDETYHLYDQQEALSLVFDATKAPLPGFKYQKMQAEWLKNHEQLMKNYCQGTAYVIPNKLVRGILKAIFALQKQPVTYEIFAEKEKAIRWAEEQMKKTPS